jgi:hypothetical protein
MRAELVRVTHNDKTATANSPTPTIAAIGSIFSRIGAVTIASERLTMTIQSPVAIGAEM